jgi:hypothetical protein
LENETLRQSILQLKLVPEEFVHFINLSMFAIFIFTEAHNDSWMSCQIILKRGKNHYYLMFHTSENSGEWAQKHLGQVSSNTVVNLKFLEKTNRR